MLDLSPIESNNNLLTRLWNKVLADDCESLGEIHKSLFSNLYNYAFSILKDEDLANDAVQEIFIKIWTKRRLIGEVNCVKVYMIVMLKRHILNQIRKMKLLKLKCPVSFEAYIVFSQEEIIIKAEVNAEKKRFVQNIINQLSKRQKKVIILKYYEEMEYADIAGIMNINYQSVVNLVHSAKKAMKKEIGYNY